MTNAHPVCSERVKMEVTAVEEKCDRRIELLTQSIKKNRKRTRLERTEEDDEEWVPNVFLHAEQNKVKVSALLWLLSANQLVYFRL